MIKNTIASPNHKDFWENKERPSKFLVDMIVLMRMSNIKNVNYTH